MSTLIHLLRVEPCALLFGKTAVGKSHYLQQELVPAMQRAGMQPLVWQLGAGSLREAIYAQLCSENADAMQAWLAEMVKGREATLWEIVQAYALSRHAYALPVFVFDQFEAFFYQSPAEQADFMAWLSDTIGGRTPEQTQEELRATPRRERTARQLAWQEPIRAKVLLLVRSEQLDRVEALSKELPAIFQHRHPLAAWNKTQAASMLQDWAEAERRSYAPEALAAIPADLAGEADEVLPLPLSIAHRQLAQTAADKRIMLEDWQRLGGLPGAYARHYAQVLESLPEAERRAARHLLEETLLAQGRRTYCAVESITDEADMSLDLLKRLETNDLVRRETTNLGTVYWLADEQLAQAIEQERQRRKIAAAEAERLRQAAEQAAKLQAAQEETQRERRRRRQMSSVAAVAVVAAVVAVGIWIWAIRLHAAQQEALFLDFYRQGIADQFIKNKYPSAIAYYNNAIQVAEKQGIYADSLTKIRQVYMPQCRQLDSLQGKEFTILMTKAERLQQLDTPTFHLTLPKYLEAARLGVNVPKVRSTVNPFKLDMLRYIEQERDTASLSNLIELYTIFDAFFESRQGWRKVAFANDSTNYAYFGDLHGEVHILLESLRDIEAKL